MNIRTLPYWVLSILGFTFLFFLGFPFGHHNESYLWIVRLTNTDLLDVLTKHLVAENFRPLGTAFAWITLELSNGKLYLQQLCNWLLALAAWSIVFFFSSAKALFGLIAFIVGGAFFSGYIYLFHLHGVFYGPLLVYISILIFFSSKSHTSLRKTIVLFLLTLFISLFHPFALFIYGFFLIGYYSELAKKLNRQEVTINAILFILTIIAYWLLLPSFHPKSTTIILRGLLTTYQMVEINIALSILAYILSLLMLSTIDMSKKRLLLWGIIFTILSCIFFFYDIPVLLLWIGMALIKSIILRQWRITSMILACMLLAAATGTGTPTYSVFVLMICSFMFAFRFNKLEEFLLTHKRIPYLFICCLIVLLYSLKSGAQIPIMSNVLNPILAEQEKTQQLEKIINWNKNATFPPKHLILFDPAGKPISSSNAIERKHRPPTQQNYLDAFLREFLPPMSNDSSSFIITFGDKYIKNKEVVFSVPGRWNGAALVFR